MNELSDEIRNALAIAIEAHRGQKDKAGVDYINHPMTVAITLAINGYDTHTIAAGLLHDVIEDTPLTLDDLKERGISNEVLEALKLLTHDKDTDYFDYVRDLKVNPIAKAVKMADLKHNMDTRRFAQITPKILERSKKYERAWGILNETED